MYIDKCPHSFAKLTSTVLPAYMKQLRTAMEKPLRASVFTKIGNGPVSIARSLKREGDFSGCYVLIEKDRPIYVGISQGTYSTTATLHWQDTL